MAVNEAKVAEAVDREFVEDFALRWLDAWNSQSAEKILALMADDVVYDDSAWPKTMNGHADVREFLDYTWRGLPDMRFEPVGEPLLDPVAPRAALYWHGFATHAGPLDPPGLEATGRKVQFEGADFHEYRDGKLARLRIVFDMAAFSRQLGVLPERGSRMERLAVRLANWQGKLRGRRH